MSDVVERLRNVSTAMRSLRQVDEDEFFGVFEDAIAEITRLRERTEWRPIETAPRDETEIIAGKLLPDLFFFAHVASYAYDDLWAPSGLACFTPTHWLPLPPPSGEKP